MGIFWREIQIFGPFLNECPFLSKKVTFSLNVYFSTEMYHVGVFIGGKFKLPHAPKVGGLYPCHTAKPDQIIPQGSA